MYYSENKTVVIIVSQWSRPSDDKTMEDNVDYDSSDEYSNYGENMLEPQVILGDGLQDSSDDDDAGSSSSMLEVQIDDRSGYKRVVNIHSGCLETP